MAPGRPLEPSGATKRPRAAIWPEGVKSELEWLLLNRIQLAGLPEGVTQYRVVEGRQYSWDRAWVAERVCAEVQGATYVKGAHSTGRGIERDCRKACLAAVLGWKHLPLTKAMILDGTAVRMIAEALGIEIEQVAW